MPHDFGTDETDEIKRIFERARYIYLRDEESAERLRNVGVRRELNVAPDLTVTLSDQFEYEEQNRRGRELLGRFGVRPDKRVLCFQSQPYPGFFEDDILQQLKRYQERTGAEVVALPLGYCHGDHEFLQSLAKRSGGLIKYAGVYSVFDMLGIIAASDLFVGTSLHGNITAFSYGIPHVFGPLPVDKAAGFLNVVNLPVELKMRSWTEINDKIDFAIELGRDYFSKKATAAKAKTYETISELNFEK